MNSTVGWREISEKYSGLDTVEVCRQHGDSVLWLAKVFSPSNEAMNNAQICVSEHQFGTGNRVF